VKTIGRQQRELGLLRLLRWPIGGERSTEVSVNVPIFSKVSYFSSVDDMMNNIRRQYHAKVAKAQMNPCRRTAAYLRLQLLYSWCNGMMDW
jgi:hypothetical protein